MAVRKHAQIDHLDPLLQARQPLGLDDALNVDGAVLWQRTEVPSDEGCGGLWQNARQLL